jgi:hypothetical protein
LRMATSWQQDAIAQSFEAPIDSVISMLRNSMWDVAVPTSKANHFQELQNKISETQAFSNACEDIGVSVCKDGHYPPSHRLSRAKDKVGAIYNFYEYKHPGWFAYFHIDYKFKIFTSVLAYRTSTRPANLREGLIQLMEDFRANS